MKPASLHDIACKKYADGYYAEKLEEGLQFQDFVVRELYKRGIVVVGYSSRRYQNEKGENMFGAEIKRDGNFRETGNLYIEVAEKSHPNMPSFTPSGVMRADNSWLYVIGDERAFYLFSIKWVRKLITKDRWRFVEIPTSQAYLMPMADAEKYCIRKIEIDAA